MALHSAAVFENLVYRAETLSGETFEDCSFRSCMFDATTFERCRFISCSFTRCSFVTPLSRYSEMRFCDFRDCSLIGMDFMAFVDNEYIEKPVNSIKNCKMKYCYFHRMAFPSYDFSGNSFSKCEFVECDLQKASFAGCELGATSFSNSDLRGADFRGASEYAIDIFTDKIKKARFSYPEVMDLLAGLDIVIE